MKLVFAAAMLTAVSFAAFAGEPKAIQIEQSADQTTADARLIASDQEVGQARRAYRAQCGRYESAAFCECLTAGVAQALAPSDVRLAARTIGERINAQGDAANSASSDPAIGEGTPMSRIEQAEGHYADACSSFRK